MRNNRTLEEIQEGKTKIESLEIIVEGTKEQPYYEIKYKEVGSDYYCIGYGSYCLEYVFEWKEQCFELVEQEKHESAKEMKQIPISGALPEGDGSILLSIENYETVAVGRYEEDELGGAFYLGERDLTCSNYGLFVNAWMPFPEAYKGAGEDD